MNKDSFRLIANYRTKRRLVSRTKKNISQLSSARSLSSGQKSEARRFYKELLNIDIPTEWHEYFYKRTGIFSPKYIPTSLYYTDIIGKANQMQFERAYSDKNITEKLLTGIRQPKTVLRNMNGYFYVNDQAVDRPLAEQVCRNIDDVIIKPTFQSHGDGVRKFYVKDGVTSIDGKTIGELFDVYGSNFVVQRVVHQHERMSALNPSSVNTLRILTYRSGMEVLVLYSVIRIGRQGWDIDNETAGGISTKIDSNGCLCKYAYGAPGNDMIETTDTGVVLDGYQIPSFGKALDAVKLLHLQLPYFDLIGWDICIDVDGEPVLIEWNVWPELSQSANGPAFGDYTERVLKEIWNRKNTR